MIDRPWLNLSYALDAASTWRRFFTSEELSEFTGQRINDKALRNLVEHDSRFIWLGPGDAYERHFVARSTLIRWFLALNLRLAGNPTVLTSGELARSLSLHCRGAQGECLPPNVTRFGRRLGLCVPARTAGRYVFPLAQILSSISEKKTAASVLEHLAHDRSRRQALHNPLQAAVDEALSMLTPRQATVVRLREGLDRDGPKTLDETGKQWNVTRERVRQIEAKAWKRLRHPSRNHLPMAGLLFDVVKRQGSLVVLSDSAEEPLRAFVAKSLEVPRAELPKLRIAVLGWSSEMLPDPSSLVPFPENLDSDVVADRLEADWIPSLPGDDLRIVADHIGALSREQLTPGKRVYMAMREIGRPAHFGAIAEVNNSLFPDGYSSEHAVHGILSREPHGIVWIGIRGTYALMEWGYERPSAPLFDQVAEIVTESYEATGKPVPFSTIAAEMGKRRSFVRPGSLSIATYLNPRVKKVSGDHFVPRNANEEDEYDTNLDELDRILTDFETKNSQCDDTRRREARS